MKRTAMLLALILLVIAPLQTSSAWSKGDSKAEQEITSLVRQFADAQKNFDAAKLDQLLAPDYIEISPVGEIDPRDKVLGFYAPEKKNERGGELLSYELDEISTRLYGETAVVIARLPFTSRSADGKTVSRALRCVFVCRKLRGKWRLVSTQYTGIRV
ncbi:MAG TPA: nuclear transport factor 2 family protein [Pyrinomonadaceae bacterium]